jgi:hypothetical protein
MLPGGVVMAGGGVSAGRDVREQITAVTGVLHLHRPSIAGAWQGAGPCAVNPPRKCAQRGV